MTNLLFIAGLMSLPLSFIYVMFNGYPSDLATGFMVGAAVAMFTGGFVNVWRKENGKH